MLTFHITTTSLKELFHLFPLEDQLTNVELGDTCHPSSGFVNEKIIEHVETVKDLLEFEYDFNGLVEFKTNVNQIKVELLYYEKQLEFKLVGPDREIEKVKYKVIELNAYQPGRFNM